MNGIFIVDKPQGPTSHDIVLYLRRSFSIKKVGHAGTLDPMATGVLVLLLGEATKLSNRLVTDDKEYEGVLRLGIRTDTHDSEGRVISAMEPPSLADEEIRKILDSFRGVIWQIPPMVSAIKHKGKKLYQLARLGIEVKREPRKVTIYTIKTMEILLPEVRFFVHCSKGTYIRKLACDIGEKLGCGASLSSLRRTRSGKFSIEDAVPFEELKTFSRDRLKRHIIS